MTDSLFNVAAIKLCTEAEGPFKRMSIWFQGCDVHCEGCCNPGLIPLVVKNAITLESLMCIIKETKFINSIEGVTFLGGEPTLQSSLHVLASRIHDEGLGTILFTGHRYENLDPLLKENLDLVIDGPFIENDIDLERNLIGSSNQRIIDITGRYADEVNWFFDKRNLRIEMSLDNEKIHINGDVISNLSFL